MDTTVPADPARWQGKLGTFAAAAMSLVLMACSASSSSSRREPSPAPRAATPAVAPATAPAVAPATAPAMDPATEFLAKLAVARDQLCACADMACMETRRQTLLELDGGPLTEAQDAERARISKAGMQCAWRVIHDRAWPSEDEVAAEVAKATYGTCDVTLTGAITATTHDPFSPSAVKSDFWLSAASQAERAAHGPDPVERSLFIFCESAARRIELRIRTFPDARLTDIPQQPGQYPLVDNIARDVAPRTLAVELIVAGESLRVLGGTLRVSTFAVGELASTVELDARTRTGARLHLAGKLVYHCAGFTFCGAW